jgi:hypothetical protein
MPQVGFEPTSPAFERTKTFHTLDRAATVFGFVHNKFLLKPPQNEDRSKPFAILKWKRNIKIDHMGIKYEDLKQVEISQGRILFTGFCEHYY